MLCIRVESDYSKLFDLEEEKDKEQVSDTLQRGKKKKVPQTKVSVAFLHNCNKK